MQKTIINNAESERVDIVEIVMPLFVCTVVVLGIVKKVPVFDTFLKGAKEGFITLYEIAPTIIGLVFAVDLLRSSGAIDSICNFIEPAAEFLGFPKEIVPMVLLRPVSGSGSTALLTAIYEDYGPDSFAGRVASVLAGASETTFYAIAMYFGSIKIKKIRHTLFAALMADFTAAVMSVITVRIFLNN